MGEKKETIRTLASGEKVRHLPPDDRHPHGKMILVPGPCPVRRKLHHKLDEHKLRSAGLRAAHRRKLEHKQARMDAKGFPKEKRSC